MKAPVVERWHEFSRPLEGYVNSMYVDVKGLVTTGVGNLIDPIGLALQLPWKHIRSGALASNEEVIAAWNDIKQNAAKLSKLHYRFAAVRNDLRLTDEDIERLVAKKLDEFYAYLKKHHFPDIDHYPADGQLGIMSMAWACGPGFPAKFANFRRCVLAGDWNGAATACKIRETNNPGVVPRNKANRMCFRTAAIVVQSGLDPEHLWWPEAPTLDDARPTPLPAIRPTLRVGSAGEYVSVLQNALNKHVEDKLIVDGRFGPKTELAVKAFQAAFGLTVDGVVGPKTWAALEVA